MEEKITGAIDLRNCKKGDMLLSKHGVILTYVRSLSEDHEYDHEVRYTNGGYGTRTNDGKVYRYNRKPEDHDIIRIMYNL